MMPMTGSVLDSETEIAGLEAASTATEGLDPGDDDVVSFWFFIKSRRSERGLRVAGPDLAG